MEDKLKDIYGFIYITTNLINGKKYIGQKKLEDGKNALRWKTYLGSGVLFKKAVNKHGKENFSRDIVAIAYNQEELNALEIDFIKWHNATNNSDYYNVAEGGAMNPLAGKSEEELREIRIKAGKSISEAISGENHYMKKSNKSEEIKLKISNSLKGIPLSEERRKNISLALNGKSFGGAKNGKHGGRNKIICITTGVIYDSLKKASFETGADLTSISKCCNGKRKTAGKLTNGIKLTWKFVECGGVVQQ